MKNRSSISLIALQVLMLIFATTLIPASAASDESFTSPLILHGEVQIGDKPAPVGTEITTELNNKLVGRTTVTSEGVYGDGIGNKLFVTCDSEDFPDVKFYINGMEVEVLDEVNLEDVNAGVVELDLFVENDRQAIMEMDQNKGVQIGLIILVVVILSMVFIAAKKYKYSHK